MVKGGQTQIQDPPKKLRYGIEWTKQNKNYNKGDNS